MFFLLYSDIFWDIEKFVCDAGLFELFDNWDAFEVFWRMDEINEFCFGLLLFWGFVGGRDLYEEFLLLNELLL